MDKFTKLILNGIEKFVSAIYDGSGNDIEATYETKTDASTKESGLSDRIDTVSQNLEALTERVTTTEAFEDNITTNATNIQANAEAITALQTKDGELQTAIDTLVIKTSEAETEVSGISKTVGTISTTVLGLNSSISEIQAVINDEASGLDALNEQADKNTADIATLLARVEALEAKHAEQS